LHSALNLAFPESAESRRALDDLSRNWVNFSDTWAKFTASPNIVGTGILQQEELTTLLGAVIELHKPIAVLLDRARRQPARSTPNYFSALYNLQQPTTPGAVRNWLRHPTLGGAFEPPYPPPEAIGEKSGEEQ
jgi:hypothetical protein